MSTTPVSRSFLPCRLFRTTQLLLRRGKPRPRAGMFPDKYRRVPTLLKPQQGGQQYFNDFLMRHANEEAMRRLARGEEEHGAGIGGRMRAGGGGQALQSGEEGGDPSYDRFSHAITDEETADLMAPKIPQMDFQNAMQDASAAAIQEEMRKLQAQDSFYHPTSRSFNEREWVEKEKIRLQEVYLQQRSEKRLQASEKETKGIRDSGAPLGAPPPASGEAEEAVSDGGGGGKEEDNGGGAVPSSFSSSSPPSVVPERILTDDYFQHRYGFSLIRHSHAPPHAEVSHSLPPHLKGHPDAALERMRPSQRGGGDAAGGVVYPSGGGITAYSQLDLWAELPRYHREMIFLYLISRRRNTYAVAYDYDGKRFLHPYTAGNRGLKGGDRGFRGDGSTDNGHQVTSAYLNDLIPKIRERRAELGLAPLQRGDKVDLVVRVMGFYNGRQGAVRAVQDRQAEFRVRYLEDITPFPLNGPKMPRGVFH